MGNASDFGWTRESNFCDSTHKPHLLFSLKWLELAIDDNVCVCAQHAKCSLSVVVDSLSRDFHLLDSLLTCLRACFHPNQIPASFKVYPLLAEMASLITGILEELPEPMNEKEPSRRSTIGDRIDGSSLPDLSTSTEILSGI